MKEKLIETQIKNWLRHNGAWVQKVHSGAMRKVYTRRRGANAGFSREHWVKLADRGTPDLLACVNGHFVAIEVKKDAKEIETWKKKAETDPRSIVQHAQHHAIKAAGGRVIVVYSVEGLQRALEELEILRI